MNQKELAHKIAEWIRDNHKLLEHIKSHGDFYRTPIDQIVRFADTFSVSSENLIILTYACGYYATLVQLDCWKALTEARVCPIKKPIVTLPSLCSFISVGGMIWELFMYESLYYQIPPFNKDYEAIFREAISRSS